MLFLVPKVKSKRARLALSIAAVCALGLSAFFVGRWSTVFSAAPAASAGPALPDPLATPAARYDWTQLPPAEFPIPPYAKYLKGVAIVLDPGHVGQTDKGGEWKRGPTGLREAEANLRVALALREFLSTAGARVILTREQDRELGFSDAEDLRDRAEIGNRADADLFVSLHHNAVGDADRNEANFSTIYYHLSPDHSPASLAAGRYLLTGLNDALRLEQHLPCALVADASADTPAGVRNGHRGYAVLRYARVPALLVESSFHTNPREEQRLRDGVYNRREAYGLFLGLARWAQAGLPRIALVDPPDARAHAGEKLVLAIDDGLSARGGMAANQVKVLANSLTARIGQRDVSIEADLAAGRMRVVLPPELPIGRQVLFVDFENIFGQHVLHPHVVIDVIGGPASTPAANAAPPSSSSAATTARKPPGRKPAHAPATPPKKKPKRR